MLGPSGLSLLHPGSYDPDRSYAWSASGCRRLVTDHRRARLLSGTYPGRGRRATGPTVGRTRRQGVADLRYAVSNDHAGTLYLAAVPATTLFLEVIANQPGPARREALDTLLDWWGLFVAAPECEIYDDPEGGPVDVCEGIAGKVRMAADMLRRVSEDPSAGGHHRPAAKELLRNLDADWDRTGI